MPLFAVEPPMKLLLALTTALLTLLAAAAARADEYRLVVEKKVVDITGRPVERMTINGQIPGPALRFREGEEVVIHVTNRMDTPTSLHWHGLILPGKEDGVPGFNGFEAIQPGQTYTYRFPIQQAGTYWYHSHNATQEQAGLYGPILISPRGPEKVQADRDYLVVLSDFTEADTETILRNLKVDPGYYNYGHRTVGDFFRDAGKFGFGKALKDRMAWGRMRMDPTDIADVTGYTFLVNGKAPKTNETFLFRPGEKVRLRFINASAMSYFDVRIPGLPMTVVAADGRDLDPVVADEFRLSAAETYDVVVEPKGGDAFTVFAEAIDRSGYARATLAVREGLEAPVPAMRPRALLTMNEMGHAMDGVDHGATDHSAHAAPAPPAADPHAGMDHSGHGAPAPQPARADDHSAHGGAAPAPDPHAGMDHSAHAAPAAPVDHSAHGGPAAAADPHAGMDHSAMDHAAMGHGPVREAKALPSAPAGSLPVVDYGMGQAMAMDHGGEIARPGMIDGSGRVYGWANGAPAGSRVLSYADLRSAEPQADTRAPEREIVVRLGGNMERYIWTINGVTFRDAEPIRLKYGERVRMRFVNESMMAHPMHLHGMFVQLENGQPAERLPDKHVVSVAPGASYSVLITADQPGEWAFHCHLLYHMESGMMSSVVVARLDEEAAPPAAVDPHAGHGGLQ